MQEWNHCMMKIIGLFLALFVYTASAQANNYYIGLNLGNLDQSGSFRVVDTSLDPTVNIDDVNDYQSPDDGALSTSLYVGYKLAHDFSLEVGFVSSEELISPIRNLNTGGEAREVSETGYYYAAFIGLWPIQNNWAFSARLGFSVWDLDYSQTQVNTALDSSDPDYIVQEQLFSDTNSAMLFGVGLNYGLNKSFELRLLLEHHEVDFEFTNLELDYDALTIGVGAVYHF